MTHWLAGVSWPLTAQSLHALIIRCSGLVGDTDPAICNEYRLPRGFNHQQRTAGTGGPDPRVTDLWVVVAGCACSGSTAGPTD